MLPIAIVGGIAFYKWMDAVTWLSPYLIFVMLTITYCRLNIRELKLGKLHFYLLTAQMVMAALTYFLLCGWDHTVASGVFICVFVPTATAAPVITAMLGGSLSRLASYSLLSNLAVALIGPAVLAAIGDHPEMTFWKSLWYICSLVVPLLIFPIITAFVMRAVCPRFHDAVANHQSISFYLWAISLFIVVGSSVSFIINHYEPSHLWQMGALAAGALVVCLIQFAVGRRIGGAFGDKVSGGQGLGQKNTVLAVWLAIAYLNPVASVAPAAYVAWQNILNSLQLMHHKRTANPKNLTY